jgi:hypothetical protein
MVGFPDKASLAALAHYRSSSVICSKLVQQHRHRGQLCLAKVEQQA